MRPGIGVESKELYECFECGARPTGPTTGSCERCGGQLCNISRPRDL